MRILIAGLLSATIAGEAAAAVRVSPTGVNVNGQGATAVFLTYGGLEGYIAAEAVWCGELAPAAPDVGLKCDPLTLFGKLPARYNWSRGSGRDAYTDIMSIPPSVTRRAYQAATAGRSAEFFYVRRFVKPASPDQYVAVTCRLTGGGARVPLSLVDVRLGFDVETPILQVATGERLPPFSARIQYTGTGRLIGRWEIVLPGQDPPTETDRLTEPTLPLEERGTQRRYTQIDRFNAFLSHVGRYTLHGPDPAQLPTAVDGQYLLLLRIEASDDKEADSDLAAIGAGPGVVHAGGVAGFPMPVLRYVGGTGGSEHSPVTARALTGLTPPNGSVVSAGGILDLGWAPMAQTLYYLIDIESANQRIHQAFVSGSSLQYRLPPFVKDKAAGNVIRWQVRAVDEIGRVVGRGAWSVIKFGP
jgi:hypothetical protein